MSVFGIKAKFATRKEKEEEPIQLDDVYREVNGASSTRIEDATTGDDFVQEAARSKYILSKPTIPKIPEQKPIVSEEDYVKTGLGVADPAREFLTAKSTFRRQFKPDQEMLHQFHKLAVNSEGRYDEESRVYVARGMENQRRQIMVRNCILCEGPADKFCEICFAPYCSLECQRLDWYKHQSGCKPVPKLIAKKLEETEYQPYQKGTTSKPAILDKFQPTVNNTNNNTADQSITSLEDEDEPTVKNDRIVLNKMSGAKLPKKKFQVLTIDFPKVGSRVIITAAKDPNQLFIRPVDKENSEKYLELMNLIQQHSEFAAPMPRKPEPGDVLLAPYNGDYCRVMVMNVGEEKAFVTYIDYGNSGDVLLSDIKKLDHKIRAIKRHTFKVILQNVQAKCENPDAIMYLNELIELSTELMLSNCYQTQGAWHVELIEIQQNRSVNRHLADLSEIKEPTVDDEKIMFTDLVSEDIRTGENVKLLVTDTSCLADSGVFSCVANEHLGEYIEILKLVNSYCANVSDGIYCPRENEMCLVKCDESWLRASGLELSGDGQPTVVCIDIGNIMKVPVEEIRKMPRQLARPYVTRYCRVKNVEVPMDAETLQMLKKIIKANDFIIAPKLELDSEFDMYDIDLNIGKSNGNGNGLDDDIFGGSDNILDEINKLI
jgi:endogenous inhibitor of DNA gyrase (YacG/DUF329 family)